MAYRDVLWFISIGIVMLITIAIYFYVEASRPRSKNNEEVNLKSDAQKNKT